MYLYNLISNLIKLLVVLIMHILPNYILGILN